MGRIRKDSAVIAELEKSGSVKVVGCFYDLANGKIDFVG